jgi:hypothetical protein
MSRLAFAALWLLAARGGKGGHGMTGLPPPPPAPTLTVTFASIATGDFHTCGLTTTHATGTLASPSVCDVPTLHRTPSLLMR